jgi:Na+(H+)/acetate symporter ActP
MFAAVDPFILAFSAITVLATVAMGFWAARKSRSASDFFVAGRGVSVGWNASAISGEYLSAASFMGVAGMVMSSGYDALWYPVCYACGYLFLLLFIAGPLRRFGAYTIPDFAEGRYDSPLFRKIAVIFVLFIGFFYTMPQMKGAGTTLAYIFPGLPYWAGVVLVGAVITLNVALGGMKGITLVQAFQYWAKMFAISAPVFILMLVYGHYGHQLELNRPSGAAGTTPSERLPLTAKAPADAIWINPFGPLTTKAAKAAKPGYRYSGPLITFDNHHPFLSFLVSTSLKISRALTPGTVGWPSNQLSAASLVGEIEAINKLSRHAYAPSLTNISVFVDCSECSSYSAFNRQMVRALEQAGIVVQMDAVSITAFPKTEATLVPVDPRPYALLYTYSLIIALVCGTAGLPHILVRFYTNPDGVSAKRTTMWVMILIGIFYVFPPVLGVLGRNWMPSLYEGAGVNGTDGIVLKLPTILKERYGVLGSILSGITCAGAFAAFMSTFSGLLVSMTGALAHDVYGRILRPQSTAGERMHMFKWCAVAIGLIAVLLGTLVENFEINFMVGQAFAIAAASYFPLLFMSVWWRGMTTRGAATGMLGGGLLAMLAISLTSWTTFITAQAAKFKSIGRPEPEWFTSLKPYSLAEFWSLHPLLRILSEQPAIWAVPLAILLMVVISKWTARTVPADIRMKMLVLHAPEQLGLKQEYIREHDTSH